jgi:hypothetical protein
MSRVDKVGVDGAIFISAFGLYRCDASYAVEVQRAYPDRLAIVKPVDPDDPAVADVVVDWKKKPGAVGTHIILPKDIPFSQSIRSHVLFREGYIRHMLADLSYLPSKTEKYGSPGVNSPPPALDNNF